MYKKLFLFLIVSFFGYVQINAMDTIQQPFIQKNKQFLDLFLRNKKNLEQAQALQRLLTGLMIQDKFFEQGKLVAHEKEKFIQKGAILENILKKIGAEAIENNSFLVGITCKTKEGLQFSLIYDEHFNHICDTPCEETINCLERKITSLKIDSEPYLYSQLLITRLLIKKEQKYYIKTYSEFEKYYNKTHAEQNKKNLSTATIQLDTDPLLFSTIKYLCNSIKDVKSCEENFNNFSTEQEKLRNLYEKGRERLKNLTTEKSNPKNKKSSQKNPFKKYLTTLEDSPQELPLTLSQNNWLSQELLIKQKKQNNTNQHQAPIEIAETIQYLHDHLSKKEKNLCISCQDGSYTSSIRDNEIVIEYPERSMTITLYAINTKKYPVDVDLANLSCTQNVIDWKENPLEALKKQGYTDPNHSYYQPLLDQQKHIIAIHTLPDEIKKHIKKFAQQTFCTSRKNTKQQDIQITFCGELKYPNGTKDTGLFIYLINSETNKIYHQMFTESSYEKTFKIFMQQGHFNNAFEQVFFPNLKKN